MAFMGNCPGGDGVMTGYVIAAGLCAVLFGLGYNWAAEQIRRAGLMDYLVGVLVVFGVAGTIVIGVLFGVVELQSAIVMLILFAGSGLPMIVGHLVPVIKARQGERGRYRAH